EDGGGAAQCMTHCLRDAGMNPEQVQYVNAHATSTPLGDRAEVAAIKSCFGEHAHKLMVSSTKSVTGHLLGAAGGIEALFSVLALRDQIVPPTMNLHNQDPACDLDFVPNAARQSALEVVMSNSFGFGGTNGCLLFKRA
ncbi:MAG: beta-ketoacyl-ACP synthase II, partial [Xanthomonadales bacterium]|nr:beta-ketoacyl-ACP synthase II [Xanthomonadales bacterium]